MATDTLFTVVGLSKLKGQYKVRFANDVMRVKVLLKGGHEDVRLVELDGPMNKMEAVKLVRGMDEFSDVVAQATFEDYIDANTVKPSKKKSVASPKVSKVKNKLDQVQNMEDAPF